MKLLERKAIGQTKPQEGYVWLEVVTQLGPWKPGWRPNSMVREILSRGLVLVPKPSWWDK